jgi:hypothetical protein
MKINRTAIIVVLTPLLIIIGGVSLLFSLRRSGNELFTALILNPIPKSVKVLHSQDETGFGGTIWLHFKTSPSDLKLILASKNWAVHPDFLIGTDILTNSEIKNWWAPQSLGEKAIKYFVVIDYDGHERVENMWVNSQMDEVYFRVTFIH